MDLLPGLGFRLGRDFAGFPKRLPLLPSDQNPPWCHRMRLYSRLAIHAVDLLQAIRIGDRYRCVLPWQHPCYRHVWPPRLRYFTTRISLSPILWLAMVDVDRGIDGHLCLVSHHHLLARIPG